jgi:GTP:adenosylcobinamide-phosphate guanylyltransferase
MTKNHCPDSTMDSVAAADAVAAATITQHAVRAVVPVVEAVEVEASPNTPLFHDYLRKEVIPVVAKSVEAVVVAVVLA